MTEMTRDEQSDVIEELREKLEEAAQVVEMLPDGYRQDMLKAMLGVGDFLGESMFSWIDEIVADLQEQEAAELEERNQEVVEAVNVVGQRLNEEAC